MKIEVNNVTKKFDNNKVLENVGITFESGKIYGLVGRNGSGKSILLKMICGFYLPTSGNILFDGKDIIKDGMFSPSTRCLIERPVFLDDLSGFDNLKLLANIQKKISDKEILDIFEKVNLLEEKDKKYYKYSLGMKKKLGIAQVLMENPEIMILDEPFNGIDETTVKKIKEILKIEKNKGKLIIITTHIKEDMEELSDIIYRFDNGQIVQKI